MQVALRVAVDAVGPAAQAVFDAFDLEAVLDILLDRSGMTATGAKAGLGLAEPRRDFCQPGLLKRHLRIGQPAGAKTIVERLEHHRLVVLTDRAGVVAHHVLQRLVDDGAAPVSLYTSPSPRDS